MRSWQSRLAFYGSLSFSCTGADGLDDLTQIVNAMGGVTAFTGACPERSRRDGDGNLTSVTDARGNQTTYTYDSMDRRASHSDPLGAAETYTYDGDGNRTGWTDRRGKVTVYQYDALNRRTFAGFGQNGSNYESTINYTWDAGSRLTEADDSIAGTIMRTFDGLDHPTDEQTPQGEVTYAYDAASRRTSLTLPNGIQVGYAYDQASRLSALTWTLGQNQIGNLIYTYDADGRIVQKSGSFAQTNLPAAVSGNSFNADNEMSAFGGQTLSYDANGNLTNDGTNTYVWDARNHLSQMSGGVTANFTYDAFGRRVAKQINGITTQFLYDRWNPVQELDASSTPSANLLGGLRAHEYFTRSDQADGTLTFLTDRLRSTIVLTDSSASTVMQYAYDPFGNTTVSGASSNNPNPYQFAGQQKDSDGSYYNVGRYYGPSIDRYTSQTALGFRSGNLNLYLYQGDDAVNLSDSSGLSWWRIIPTYGMWCGPDWSNGRWYPSDARFGNGECNGPLEADSLDNCCKIHDCCYDFCQGRPGTCKGFKRCCMAGCDDTLINCALGSAPPTTWGQLYRQAILLIFPLVERWNSSYCSPSK